MTATWNDAKAAQNLQKHGVSFEEAVTVLNDENATWDAQLHADEERFAVTGYSSKSNLLIVIITEVTDGQIRIISARRADSRERKRYEGGHAR